MSEKKNITNCPSCGAEIPVDNPTKKEKFCEVLRGVLEDDEFDTADEEVALATENVCSETDPLQNVSVETPVLASPKDKIKAFLGKRLAIRVGVFVLSLALLALSFAPLISCEIEWENYETETVTFSGMDCLKVVSVSTLLLGGSYDRDTGILQLNQWGSEEGLKDAVISTAMADQMIKHPTVAIATVFYLLYTVFCVLLVVVSAKNLITEFFTAKKNRDRQKKHASDWLYCLLLCLFPVMIFSLKKACQICMMNVVADYGSLSFGVYGIMAWGAVLSVMLLLPGSLFLCAARSFGTLRPDRRYFDRRRVKHILCVFLIILAFLFSFLPCLQISVWDVSVAEEKSFGVELRDFQEVTFYEWLSYQNDQGLLDKNVVSTVVNNDVGNVGYTLMNSVLIASNKITGAYVFHTVLEIAFIMTLFFGGLFLFVVVRRGFFGGKNTRLLTFSKALTMICISLNLLLCMLLSYLLNFSLPNELSPFIGFQVGIGVILAFVCVLLAILLTLGKKKDVEYIDDEYDNPDISYAPYVLDAKK